MKDLTAKSLLGPDSPSIIKFLYQTIGKKVKQQNRRLVITILILHHPNKKMLESHKREIWQKMQALAISRQRRLMTKLSEKKKRKGRNHQIFTSLKQISKDLCLLIKRMRSGRILHHTITVLPQAKSCGNLFYKKGSMILHTPLLMLTIKRPLITAKSRNKHPLGKLQEWRPLIRLVAN